MIGRQIGPYEILSLLGAGGMGEVYRARHTTLGREDALKILPAALAADSDRVARFAREARVLAALKHPHIGEIFPYLSRTARAPNCDRRQRRAGPRVVQGPR